MLAERQVDHGSDGETPLGCQSHGVFLSSLVEGNDQYLTVLIDYS
jgi:hypothetical protein